MSMRNTRSRLFHPPLAIALALVSGIVELLALWRSRFAREHLPH